MDERHYTTAEIEAMEAIPTIPPLPERVGPPTGAVQGAAQLTMGAIASLRRTYLGLKQAAAYLAGDDSRREAVNEEIRRMEEEYAPYLSTAWGKVGEMAGVGAQFMGPGAVAVGVSKALPQAVVRGARVVAGAPGTVGRAAAQGAGFEAAQPVQPAYAGTEEYALGKLGRTAVGAAGGAAAGKVAKMITSPGPTIMPERGAVVKEAQRYGIELTPAQRTGDITLAQYEEGLASRPGSAATIARVRGAQQAALNKKAAEAIGSPAAAPTEAVLAAQREAAARGYEPIAGIPQMSWDTKYITDLEAFAKKQATKATGSVDAANVAMRVKKGAGKTTGSGFLEELQGVRDMSFGARQKGDVATAKQLGDLADIMEDFAERRVAKLSKAGRVPADAMEQFRAARAEYAKIHAVEKATEPVSGRVSPLKYLSQEFKRQPASRGRGTSPSAQGLKEVGDVARVLKQVTPYIGSSGTAERIAGQQLVEASQGPLAAIRAAGPIAKNYMAAQLYMKYGGRPGFFGTRLTPGQNAYVRRLIPAAAIAGGEAGTE